MKRTQIYIEDDIFKELEIVSKEQMVSISKLIRDAINKMYAKGIPANAEATLKKAAGIWKERKDIVSAEDYVRKMRRDTRQKRLGGCTNNIAN